MCVAHKKLKMPPLFQLDNRKLMIPVQNLLWFLAGIMISFQVLFTVFVPAVLLTTKQAVWKSLT